MSKSQGETDSKFARRDFLLAGGAGMIASLTALPEALAVNSNGGADIQNLGCDITKQVFEIHNVKCFYRPEDVADDSRSKYLKDLHAIQDAIDQLPVFKIKGNIEYRGIGEVYLPPGIYEIPMSLNLRHGMTFRGAGPNATFLSQTGNEPCLQLKPNPGAYPEDPPETIRYIRVEGLTIIGSSMIGPGIRLEHCNDSLLSDLVLNSVGIEFDYSICNRLHNVKVVTPVNDVCLQLFNQSNATSIVGCRFSPGFGKEKKGIWIQDSIGTLITSSTFDEGNIGVAITAQNIPPSGNQISGCYFEHHDVSIKGGYEGKFPVFSLAVTGSFFGSNRTAAVQLDNCQGAFFGGNHFSSPAQPLDAAIQLTENAQAAFVGNSYTGWRKQAVQGPTSDASNHYYSEITNSGVSGYPFRLTGTEFGFLDLPIVSGNRAVNFSDQEALNRYGRLFLARTAAGTPYLGIIFGDQVFKVASLDQPFNPYS